MRFKANTRKTGGFQRGLCSPFGTRPCLQGVVCVIPAGGRRRRGNGGAMRFMSRLDRQKNGRRDCRLGCARMTAGFAESGQGYAFGYPVGSTVENHFICRKHY